MFFYKDKRIQDLERENFFLASKLNELSVEKMSSKEESTTYVTVKTGEINDRNYKISLNRNAFGRLKSIQELVTFITLLKSNIESKNLPDSIQNILIENVSETLIEQKAANEIYSPFCYKLHDSNDIDDIIAEFVVTYTYVNNASSGTLYIASIEVTDPKKRCMGIGTLLLQFIIELGKYLNVKEITGAAIPIESSDKTMCPKRLLGFYKRNGFTITNKDKGHFILKL
ncbi:hypothetical protein CN931_23945 [Bacillus sp. AFS054943]|uniref:N-acetyltransferase domain-containing protein n=1 Tax=Bacillus cereus TaxID=1396 RepID=A0A2C1LNN3_BACCE|nr:MULTISPECIES: GNAT family N-acetyltransferase [Bacillus]PGL78067.1 hypothetical protein CN931_23945 [Bacillus sp. AFS054943]PGT99853.1 hypothetical protein COD19_18145 [Bacillus cereus]